MSARIGGGNKTSIMDHHRSVQWSEKEYATLLGVVQDKAHVLRRDLHTGIVEIPAYAPEELGDSSKKQQPAPPPGDSAKNKRPSPTEEDLRREVLFTDYCGVMYPVPYTSRAELEARMKWGK